MSTAWRQIGVTTPSTTSSYFVDSGYDDGAGGYVYSEAALARTNPLEAIKRDPVPAAIAAGVGLVVIVLLIGAFK